MKRLSLYIFIVFGILASCYPGGPEYYEETDIVLTEYNQEFNFASQKTYSMPDSVVKVSGNLIEGELPEFIKEPYNTEIINRIASNMSSYGWERTDDPENADVVLFPVSWTNTTVYYWYDYWCWYYYWYCGWGWYYPPVSSFTTGTLVMAIITDGDEFVEPSRVWTGAANGLLSGAQNMNRINNAIDQAFMQSSYLKIN